MAKTLATVLAACSALAAAADTIAKWQWREGVGTSVTNMADWFDTANWVDGVPVNGTDHVAYFTNAFSGVRYVKISSAIAFRQYKALTSAGNYGWGSANRQIVVSEHALTPSPSPGFLDGADFYADLVWPEVYAYTSTSTLAGDIRRAAMATVYMTLNTGLDHRLDHYTWVPGGVRTNFFPYTSIQQSYSPFAFYGPESSATNLVGQWTRVKDQPYAWRTGARHAIPVGTYVHGAGIPEGTWVKRLFTDDVIELSQPATADADGADLAFDAQTANVSFRVKSVSRSSDGNALVTLNKYRAEDGMRLEVDDLALTTTGPFPFRTAAGRYPGTFVLHNCSGSGRRISLENCHIEFAPATNGSVPGFPDEDVKMVNAAHVARLTVTNGISARIGSITNLVGTVVKDGAGALAAGLSKKSTRNTGAIMVEAGVFGVAEAGDGETAYVATLAVSNGATVQVAATGLDVGTLVLAPGATVAGPGEIRVKPLGAYADVVLKDGGTVVYVGDAATPFRTEAFPTNVVGTPALWMDVSKPGAVSYDAATLAVTRLDDVRGDGWIYATPYKASPTLVTNAQGGAQHIYFERMTVEENKQGLKWSEQLTGIRAVFKVMCAIDGGGSILGASSGVADFWKSEDSSSWQDSVFLHTDSYPRPNAIVNCDFLINGERRDWRNGYAYKGGSSKKQPNQYAPMLVEVHPAAPGAAADTFSYISGGTSRTGRERLYEIIVYTNALTEAERQQVSGYLMKKWLNAEVDYSLSARGAAITNLDATAESVLLGVSAGTAGRVNTVTGSGTVTKAGAGTLYLDDYCDAAGALDVQGGTLKLRSVVPSAADVPATAYLHLDAGDDASLTLNGSHITAWADVRGAGYPVATNRPGITSNVLTNNCVNGKRYVDLMGSEGPTPRTLFYEECWNLQSVLAVTGTRTWNGTLVGSSLPCLFHKDGHLTGLWRTAGGRYGPGTTPDSLFTASFHNTDWVTGCAGPGATRSRVNGEDVDGGVRGVTHQGDLVSITTHEPIFGDMLSGGYSHPYMDSQVYYSGAQHLGEYILFRESLSRETVRRVEAYLARKWFDRESVGYRAAKAGSVNVASGATLELCGTAPITVKTLSGGGTIIGAVTLAADAELSVAIVDGAVAPLTVSGALSGGGTVRVTGDPQTLPVGTHTLLSAGSLSADVWTVELTAANTSRRHYRVRRVGNTLVLQVSDAGGVLLLL